MTTDLFTALMTADEDADGRLHARLERDATAAGLVDVAYRTLDTTLGSLLLAATDRGLVRVAFAAEDHDAVLQNLSEQVSPRVLHAPHRLDPAARELDEYLTGHRRVFDLPLDWQLARGPFRRAVLLHLADITYGRTVSYAELAATAGNPRAVRAVGTACATNPLPVVVPCHRVVRSDGAIGQYLGGTQAKRALLGMESAADR